MADVLGIQKSLDAYKSILETIQAFSSAVDSLTSATPAAPEGMIKVGNLYWDRSEMTELAYFKITGKSPSSNGPNMPVTNVTWFDAAAACKMVHKRLPTGEEWKRAAGPNEFATADGKLVDSNGIKEANYNSKGPMDVKSFQPNSNVLYDMTGNVWEWDSDGSVRGGSWYNYDTDVLRAGFRTCHNQNYSSDNVGFRCVSPEDSKK